MEGHHTLAITRGPSCWGFFNHEALPIPVFVFGATMTDIVRCEA